MTGTVGLSDPAAAVRSPLRPAGPDRGSQGQPEGRGDESDQHEEETQQVLRQLLGRQRLVITQSGQWTMIASMYKDPSSL